MPFQQLKDNPKTYGLVMAAVTALTWSLLAIVLKVALNSASAMTIIWFRFFFALLFLSGFLIYNSPGAFKILPSVPPLGVLCGLMLAANYAGYIKGVELTSPSNAQVLIQLSPLLLMISGFLFFKERLNRHQVLGVVIALVGFTLFFYDQWAHSTHPLPSLFNGNLWLVMASIAWASYASLQKRLVRHWTPEQINLLIYLVASLTLSLWVDWSEPLQWSVSEWMLMTFLGLNTLVAYGALGIALQHSPASQVSLIITCNPLLTLLFMGILTALDVTWIAAQQITTLGICGALLVIMGLILTIAPNPKSEGP